MKALLRFPAYFIMLLVMLTVLLSCKESYRTTNFSNGQTQSKVAIKDGMLHGEYQSFYEDGLPKSHGHFRFNQRVGIWKVWDQKEKLIAKRKYRNNFECLNIYSTNNSSGELLQKFPVKEIFLKRSDKNYFEYNYIEEKDVLYSKRIWRFIPINKYNVPIFNIEGIQADFITFWLDSKVLAYKDDKLYESFDALQKLNKLVKESQFIGLKIMEENFYDKASMISESRIISLCPVFGYDGGYEEDFAWFYYPDLRGLFASKSVKPKRGINISNIEDLFHFDHFHSTIYKEANVRDQPIADIVGDERAKEEANRIEIEVIDIEHDIWIDLIRL